MTEKQEKQDKDEAEKQTLEHAGNEQQEESNSVDRSKVKHTLLLSIIIFVVVLIAALSIFNRMQLQQVRDDVVALDSNAQLNDIMQQFDQQLSNRQRMHAEMEARLSELENRQQSLQSLVSKQVTQSTDINVAFALAEIEYLLTVANYRLQLNHDVSTSVTAIQAADKRLQGLNVSGKVELRKQLIANINELQSMNQADLSGLGLFLSDLINRVDDLPLNDNTVINDPNFSAPNPDDVNQEVTVSNFFSLVWEELKSLVIISRDENVSKVMLLPDQVYFLQANIKLELANARFAVFNRDTENFRSSVELIQSWLNNYFNQSDAAVNNILQSLQTMQQLDLSFPVMDLSSSIETVRAMSHELEQTQ